ncbi:MAG TPA: ABC transporter substrate-binding protein, partial [Ktedonobacteraceae bacterium]
MYSSRKRLLTKLPFFLCNMVVILVLVGCGNAKTSASTTSAKNAKAPANQQILVQPVSGYSDVQTLDPALADEIPALSIDNMLYSGLVTLNDKLQVQGELAASYSVAADGTTWTFHLKPNLKFSDNQPLTSTDVAYSIDRAVAPALKSGVAPYYLSLIKDVTLRNTGKIKSLVGDSLLTPDKQTLIIKTSKPAAYFLQTLTYPTSFIVEKSLLDKYGNNFTDHLNSGAGGSGPWMVSKYIHNQEIDFVPNPHYFGPKPQLKKVVMPFVPQGDTTYKQYQVNQVDSAPVPSTEVANAQSQFGSQFHQQPLLDTYYLSLNYLAKPFDNIKIRQAFDLAIDKDAIARNVFHGTVIPTNHIVPDGMPGYNPNLTGPQGQKQTSGNAQLAKQLFTEGLKEE